MTISAVALTLDQKANLLAKGVIDSKKLAIERIRELSRTIRQSCLGEHTVVITPERFNQLLSEIRNEGKSLNDMLAWGHQAAITRVYELLGPKTKVSRVRIIIDEFDRIKTERRLARLSSLSGITIEQRPEAEEDMAVASAGIVARDAREGWIDRESKRMNHDLRKLSPIDVMNLAEASSIAKTSYLKRRTEAK